MRCARRHDLASRRAHGEGKILNESRCGRYGRNPRTWATPNEPAWTTSLPRIHGLAPSTLSTAVQNITGHPALSVPFGRLANGLPFGIQLTAPRFHDLRLIELAADLEAAFPWSRCAPGYTPLDVALGLAESGDD